MKRIALLLFAPFAWALQASPPEKADLVLTQGQIITMDPNQPRATALAVKDGRILAVGSASTIAEHVGVATQTLDLNGATAAPGFIEGHGHLYGIGLAKVQVTLSDAQSWDEVVERVARAAAAAKPGEWVIGRGWHQEKWKTQPKPRINGYPFHYKLSEATPNNPVRLTHASGHACFANLKAMAMAGITQTTKDPAGGQILRDREGNASGVFLENAAGLIDGAYENWLGSLPKQKRKARDRMIFERAASECLSRGITSFQDAGLTLKHFDLLKELRLPLRIWAMVLESNETLRRELPKRNFGFSDSLRLGGVKKYYDGALGSRGAWLFESYSDRPNHLGQVVTPPDELRETAQIALEHGLQLCTHAIGDRANREVLDLYESVLKGEPKRWRIEHAQHLNPRDVPRFAKLNVIASMQGAHCVSDAPFVEKRLGSTRAKSGAYLWRSLWESGALIASGTDAPVESVDPLANLYALVTRRTHDGKLFYQGQSLSVEQALRSYTWNNAYAAFQDQEKGSLKPGKFADIVVLSQDLTRIRPSQILKTRVLVTLVGGQIRYDSRQPSP